MDAENNGWEQMGNKTKCPPLYPDNLPTPEVVDQSCPKIPEMRDRRGKQPLHTAAHSESELEQNTEL